MQKKYIEGKTPSGFEFKIPASVMNNMELVDLLSDYDGGENPIVLSKLCNLVLGKDQKQKLYDHVREKDGTVPIEKITTEIGDIFKASGSSGKNS